MKKKVDELSRHGTQETIQTNGTKLMILRSILNNDHCDDFDDNLWWKKERKYPNNWWDKTYDLEVTSDHDDDDDDGKKLSLEHN